MERIRKDFIDMMKCADLEKCGISVQTTGSMLNFNAVIKGPEGTPYEGGFFDVVVTVPDTYPFMPPEVRFITNIWHPNVCSTSGKICLNILGGEWCGSMSLRVVLLSVQNLLINPEGGDPQDQAVGAMMEKDLDLFIRTARQWTFVFAQGPYCDPEFIDKLSKLEALSVSSVRALKLLSHNDWNIEQAAEEVYENF